MDNKPCCEKCRHERLKDGVVTEVYCTAKALRETCPCHIPPVEGEWAERFDDEFLYNDVWLSELYTELRHGDPDFKAIKSFITNLLHSEREKSFATITTMSQMWAERVALREKEARAEERERIVKMCEEIDWRNAGLGHTPYDSDIVAYYEKALSSLRDKLSNK